MSEYEKTLVAKYAAAFEKERLSNEAKKELIRLLSKPAKKDKAEIEKKFWASFGSWPSDKSAEEIAQEIRSARQFRDKDLSF